jgi:subfamily B ATP-binding cassette protein HlyB/CyaB
LLGPSGSGKSTIARLLQGFYLPSEGAISIDGMDLRHLAANELRGNFGIVPQETRLFSGSILQNLLDANPSAGFDDVVEACRRAQVHAVIESLRDGYSTRIGENGVGLSGGQKQRLAIARALLKRPRILVFDEATSSLDAELVRAVIDTVNELRERVGVLFIAHELPEGLRCDRIVRLEMKAQASEGP